MAIRKVTSTGLVKACRRLLARDPVANVLPLGDLHQPLLGLSDIYCAVDNNQVVGVCAIYRAYPIPSIVLGTANQSIKQVLVKKAISEVSDDFLSLCQPEDTELFKNYSTVLHSHSEQQMIANPPKKIECGDVRVEKVGKNELKSLDSFYGDHSAEAWLPVQLKAGPYYCVKDNGKIISAAGVHIVTPQIAQLGNIITDKTHRNRGFATACTSVLATDLASKGRIISLFVRKDNDPAIHVYEKLGFCKANDIAFIVMRKRSV